MWTFATTTQQGRLAMIGAMLISGTIGAMVVWSELSPQTVIFYRCLFGAMILGLLGWLSKTFKKEYFTKKALLIALLGGIALTLNWFFLFSAYQNTSIGLATTIYNTQPFIYLFLTSLLLKEKIRKDQIIWVVISFIGLALIMQTKPTNQLINYQSYLIGVLQALLSATLYALVGLSTKYLKQLLPSLIAFLHLITGLILFLPFANTTVLTTHFYSQTLLIAITLGVVHTGIMYILLYRAVQQLPTIEFASLSFIYPLVAIVLDIVLFHVKLTPYHIIGMVLILLGAMGVNLKINLFSKST